MDTTGGGSRFVSSLAVALGVLYGSISTATEVSLMEPYFDSPSSPLSDEERLLRIEAEWPQALERNDAAWLKHHTMPNLIFLEPDGSMLDQAGYLADRGRNPDRIESGENNVGPIRLHGDVAIVHGDSHFRTIRDGERYSYSFRWSATYLRHEGVWRCALVHLTPINPGWRAAFRREPGGP